MKKEELKIVYFGTPEFATGSLRALVENGYNVRAVVTATDKPAKRGHKMTESDVKKYAKEAGLPVLQPEKLRDEAFIEQLRALDADLFIVVAFRMLPKVIWDMPRLGTFNLHASLLPRYRGAAPINWALINGEKVTGVTTFFLREEIDTGNIIRSREVEIGDEENIGSLYDRLMEIGAAELLATVDEIAAGSAKTRPQEEGDYPVAPKINKETCRIDWRASARDIHNLVRGMSPYPCAWTYSRDENGKDIEMKILRTAVAEESGAGNGAVRVQKNRLFAETGAGVLEILELKPAGKRVMTAAEFLAGNHPVMFHTDAQQ